jgi:predicted esterase
MLGLAEVLQVEGTSFLIPQAADNRWYPATAFGPLEPNEPDLSSALQLIGELIHQAEQAGLSKDEIVLGGFSQGACLAAEYFVRHPDRYGGLFVFSGALIGPPGQIRDLEGNLQGTKVFIGGGDVDPWVSVDLIQEAARILTELQAEVDLQIYPGMGHTINQEEIGRVQNIITSAGRSSQSKEAHD